MLCGKPVIVSNNRGHKDLVESDINGYLIDTNDYNSLSDKVLQLMTSKKTQVEISRSNILKAKKYSSISVLKELESLFINK